MRQYAFTQVDVFTDKPFLGNPLAVFPDAAGMSDHEMQLVAREMNLSETTFVLPARDPRAAYRVRIFTPVQELPYAGHPSVGTAWHLATLGRIALKPGTTRIFQETGAGVLPMDLTAGPDGRLQRVATVQKAPVFDAPIEDRARVARALGLAESDLAPGLPIQKVSTGLPWLLVPLADADALDRVAPDASAFRGQDALHENVYPFTLRPSATDAQTEARGFPMREFEDPVTGSASGCLGAYVAQHGVLPAFVKGQRLSFVHAQGRHLQRSGRVALDVRLGPSGEPVEVSVGGTAARVLQGHLEL